MKLLRRLREFAQSVPSRIVGSHVNPECERITTLSSRIEFPPDEQLEQRRALARSALPVDSVKADRVRKGTA